MPGQLGEGLGIDADVEARARIGTEEGFCDLQGVSVLEEAAVAAVARLTQPAFQGEPVARQATVAAQLRSARDDAVPGPAAEVGLEQACCRLSRSALVGIPLPDGGAVVATHAGHDLALLEQAARAGLGGGEPPAFLRAGLPGGDALSS